MVYCSCNHHPSEGAFFMKKRLIILGIAIILLIGFAIWFFNKETALERRFNISIPFSAKISEYDTAYSLGDCYVMAAKIEISKDDYKDFVSKMSEDYDVFYPFAYDIDNTDVILPPNSDMPINIEKHDEDLTWWDLETADIFYLFHYETESKIPGNRCGCTRRIYVTENSENVVLYLYYIQ